MDGQTTILVDSRNGVGVSCRKRIYDLGIATAAGHMQGRPIHKLADSSDGFPTEVVYLLYVLQSSVRRIAQVQQWYALDAAPIKFKLLFGEFGVLAKQLDNLFHFILRFPLSGMCNGLQKFLDAPINLFLLAGPL